MSFLLLVFLYNSIIAETRPLWDFFLPLRTVGLHFGESRNTSYALRFSVMKRPMANAVDNPADDGVYCLHIAFGAEREFLYMPQKEMSR